MFIYQKAPFALYVGGFWMFKKRLRKENTFLDTKNDFINRGDG